MGGKNPIMIFDDCNYEKMLQTVIRSSFTNQGQIRLCGSRIYVQKGIYNKFRTDLINAATTMKNYDPWMETPKLEP